MKTPRSAPRFAAALAAFCLAGFASLNAAEGFAIRSVFLDGEQRPCVTVPNDRECYFVLLRGGGLESVDQPVHLALSDGEVAELVDRTPARTGTAFYRVRQVPRLRPSDLDGDGMDDFWELQAGAALDPLEARDAVGDPDRDGRISLMEYQAGTSPISPQADLPPLIISSDLTLDCSDQTLAERDVIVTAAILTIDCDAHLGSLILTNDARVVHSQGLAAGLRVTTARNIYVDSSSRIDVSGRGYGPDDGPGKGETGLSGVRNGAGASHGGRGQNASSSVGPIARTGPTYGDFLHPSELGSGGGSVGTEKGGYGGGAVRLVAGGVVHVDGYVVAHGTRGDNGSSWDSGAGAGGSIAIEARRLAGGGRIAVQGATSYNGGDGGGGRIGIVFEENGFTGSLSAAGDESGGPGTVWLRAKAESLGTLIVDDEDNGGSSLGCSFAEFTEVPGHVVVRNQGWITHPPASADGLHMKVAGDFTVEQDGWIYVSGHGYGPGEGPGAGEDGLLDVRHGAGASHGGRGQRGSASSGAAAEPGPGYDSFLDPSQLGSGGGSVGAELGGAGGGLVRLEVAGTMQVDGKVFANGTRGDNSSSWDSGAGSGGSLNLKVGRLAGSGRIEASGAPSYNGGDGGGGCIAVVYGTNDFAGTISAYGSESGGAGTVWLKDLEEAFGTLIVDDEGTGSGLGCSFAELTEVPGHVVIRKGGWITHPPRDPAGLQMTVAGDLTVEEDGWIYVSGHGHGPGQGPGAGQGGLSDVRHGAGASHGGRGQRGGASSGAASEPGPGYGSFLDPGELGSGGGSVGSESGGTGGGLVRLEIAGTMRVDGRVFANGTKGDNSSSWDSGAGSGGSINLRVGRLAGAGRIEALGAASYNGGDGGGGRIAVVYGTNAFTGAISAYGSENGGAGTVWLKDLDEALGTLIVDDEGTGSDLGCEFVGPTTIPGNLVVRAGWISHPQGDERGLQLSVGGDLRLEQDGFIYVTGRGYEAGTGPGVGSDGINGAKHGAGGGYGGAGQNGGASEGGPAAGGQPYGTRDNPNELGSPGGTVGTERGGYGGGLARLSVDGRLQVIGRLSADGTRGDNSSGWDSGAGSGGGIWIHAWSLEGSGIIRATGGDSYSGGDGGGGRIAIYTHCAPETNSLTLSVAGGSSGAGVGTLHFAPVIGTNSVITNLAVNPRQSFLRTSEDPEALASPAVRLADLGINPCDLLQLRRTGAFQNEPPLPSERVNLIGVFSASSELLPASRAHRIPGALPASGTVAPVITVPAIIGVVPTDIPEDFEIGADSVVVVPEGARFLFLAPHDYFYGDNLDTQGDYGVELTRFYD